MSSILKPLYLAFLHVFKRTFTIKHPYEALKPSERYRGRLLLDPNKCVSCGICTTICPTRALELIETSTRKLPQLDLARCCFCGFCAIHCPRTALKMTQSYELGEYKRDSLIYSPDKFSKAPAPIERRTLSVEKIDKLRGVSHG